MNEIDMTKERRDGSLVKHRPVKKVRFWSRINYAALRKNLPMMLFVLSCMFWSFAYGVAVQRFEWFPYEIIGDAEEAALEARRIIRGSLPWYYRRTERTETVIVHRPHAFADGLTLVSGLTKEGNIAVKVLTRDGEVLHQWHIDWFDRFWPDPRHLPQDIIPKTRPATHIHGVALLENGDLVFNLENLGLTRMGLCGNVIWQLPYQTHHALHVDETGNIWVAGQKWIKEPSPALPDYRPPFLEFMVLQVTPGGDVLREISISDLLIKNGLRGLLYMRTQNKPGRWTGFSGDVLHLNDVEIFPSHLQPGVFEPGDVMISLRNINAIMVFNPDTLHIKYLSVGKVVLQHDPDFIDGERISIFDNNRLAPASRDAHSRIVVVSAKNYQEQVIYSGSAKAPFFSHIMGKHQWLPNGNILITESTQGRAFEINAEGALVWEYFNLIDKGRLGLTDEAQRLPPVFTRAFFEAGRRACRQTSVP
jgi:Arylsulfotransferase (ASST)